MTVTNVKLVDHRRHDTGNLEKRILGNDEKASRLTRTELTIDGVRALALARNPTNDATFTFNAVVLHWREKVEKMSTVIFWDKLNPKEEFKKTWTQARGAMIWVVSMLLKPKLKKANNNKARNPTLLNWGDKRKRGIV